MVQVQQGLRVGQAEDLVRDKLPHAVRIQLEALALLLGRVAAHGCLPAGHLSVRGQGGRVQVPSQPRAACSPRRRELQLLLPLRVQGLPGRCCGLKGPACWHSPRGQRRALGGPWDAWSGGSSSSPPEVLASAGRPTSSGAWAGSLRCSATLDPRWARAAARLRAALRPLCQQGVAGAGSWAAARGPPSEGRRIAGARAMLQGGLERKAGHECRAALGQPCSTGSLCGSGACRPPAHWEEPALYGWDRQAARSSRLAGRQHAEAGRQGGQEAGSPGPGPPRQAVR